MRLFLDANSLFLAGYSGTSPVHDLLALAAAGDCELLSSEYAFEEARRNLALKSSGGSVAQFEAATAVIIHFQEASGPAIEQAQSANLSDASDIPILAAALQAGADALVTGRSTGLRIVLRAAHETTHREIAQMADLTISGTTAAAARAFAQAKVKASDIDVVELYDAFTINTILFLKEMVFCPRGEGGRFVADGAIGPGGVVPVNTNGGELSSEAVLGLGSADTLRRR